MRPAKMQISCACAGWSASSLGAHVSCTVSNIEAHMYIGHPVSFVFVWRQRTIILTAASHFKLTEYCDHTSLMAFGTLLLSYGIGNHLYTWKVKYLIITLKGLLGCREGGGTETDVILNSEKDYRFLRKGHVQSGAALYPFRCSDKNQESSEKWNKKLKAQVDQKSLLWITLIMICYISPWWQSWPSDQIAFSNPESDVVWRVSRLPNWPPSWILELKDLAILTLHVTPMPPIKFRFNLT